MLVPVTAVETAHRGYRAPAGVWVGWRSVCLGLCCSWLILCSAVAGQPAAPVAEWSKALRALPEKGEDRAVKEQCLLIQIHMAVMEEPLASPLTDDLLTSFLRPRTSYSATLLAHILAHGEEGVDEKVFGALRSLELSGRHLTLLPFFAAALANSRRPSPDVTEQLVAMAARERRVQVLSFYSLVLALRGDRTRDWTGDVMRYLQSPPDMADADEEAEVLDHSFFVALLPHVGMRLAENDRLTQVLWSCVASVDHRDPSSQWLGTCCLAALAVGSPAQVTQDRIDLVKRKAGGLPPGPRALWSLCLARMDRSNNEPIRNALELLGSDAYGLSVNLLLTDVAFLLFDPTLVAGVQAELVSRSRKARLGAVRVAGMLGPQASAMLAQVNRLANDPDEEVARTARSVRQVVAGVGPDGQWRVAPM